MTKNDDNRDVGRQSPDPSAASTVPDRSDRPSGRVLLAAGVLPLLVVAGAAALLWSWRGQLPDPVATHWDASGQADGFSSHGGMVAFALGFGGLWAVLGLAFALFVRVPALARAAAGIGAGTAGFVAAVAVLSTAPQRGLSDAADAALPLWTLPAAIGVGLLVGLAAAALIPRWTTEPPGQGGGDPGRPVDLSPTERVFWARTVASATWAIVLLVLAIPGTVVVVLLTRQWALASITVALLAGLVLLVSVRVTVDDQGLLIRGLLRWPRVRVAVDEVAAARVVSVRALRDFGGYGFRIGFRGEVAGASGFVLRSGEALLVERHDGARTVVVVDDAATAAGLLNALVERRG